MGRPTSDYLLPPLKGYRLAGSGYEPIEPEFSGGLACRELGLQLRLEAGRLVISHADKGRVLLDEAETGRAARLTERQARLAERPARLAAEVRADEEAAARQSLEQELQRLREQLERKHPPG